MEADWSVACGADDPVVVVPWGGEVRDPSTGEPIQFIDLRSTLDAILEIPDAVEYPDLAVILRSWNRPDAAVFTAKCDVWNYPEKFFDAEDLPGFAFAHGSYIDLFPTNPAIFCSFTASERRLRCWTEAARSILLPASRCEWTLRPAQVLPPVNAIFAQIGAPPPFSGGFATSLYVWGYGQSPHEAALAWSSALLALEEIVATDPELPAS
jgi:hypothetical protein